jgi:hypothetical protein
MLPLTHAAAALKKSRFDLLSSDIFNSGGKMKLKLQCFWL